MQNFTTNAINLKSYNLSETDKIIVMYSKDKGIIKGVAKGAKKTTSKLGGRMDMLVANRLMLHKGRNLDTICQAQAINTFKNTRNDIAARLCTASAWKTTPTARKSTSCFTKPLRLFQNPKTKCSFCFPLSNFSLKSPT